MDAVTLIKGFEGLGLKSYQDAKGVWTVGYGATGEGIGPGVEWTEAEAVERLAKDVEWADKAVTDLVRVPLTPNQRAALTSFVFNVGRYNLQRSGLLRFLNRGDYKKAADQFLLWDKVGSYAVPGLAKRRAEEREVFLTP